MRFKLLLIVAISLTLLPLVQPTRAADPPKSPFLELVYRYADALLVNGRDVYGPQQSGLFLSALDRGGLKPLATRPAAPGGIRREDRVGPPWEPLVGANPMHDQNLLRLLYTLTELSQKAKYREAADEALRFFLENAPSRETGLLPWGEHMSWNVLTDEPMPKADSAVHEFSRPWLLWDRCFALSPAASKAFALGLWQHQIADPQTAAFDRHAPYWKHGPKAGNDYCRHAGFYIRTWADAYAHTSDPVFLTAIETMLTRLESRRHPQTRLISATTGNRQSDALSTLSLAIDCDAAAGRVPADQAQRLRRLAAREDELFCSLPHDLAGARGFVTTVDWATGNPQGRPTPLWDIGYGESSTAGVALMCASRYYNSGLSTYRGLIAAAADAYLDTGPPEDADTWPMIFGHAISLELAAWRLSARPEYLARAQQLGYTAVQRFWEDSPLPRASLKTGHYESITGPDTLALSLVELHLSILHITALSAPANTIDR